MNERDGLGLLVEENHQLKQMVAENDRQFCQIANFLNGDARDNGTFHISYSCCCNNCGFEHRFESEEPTGLEVRQ